MTPSHSGAPESLAARGTRETTRVHIRGSNLLLFGRLLSLGINFLTNILTVRYLSKSDYGALSYALTIGSAGASVLLLGMPRAVARFAPLYQERGEFKSMFGSLVLTTGIVASVGALGTALALFLRVPLIEPFVRDPLALALLLILIGFAPLQALDTLFQGMLAVFAGSGAIFFRRYLLGPLLKLGAVLAVVTFGGSVRFLAWAYLAASLLGVLLYGPMLLRALRKADLTRHWSPDALVLPWREVLGFSLPLVLVDVLLVLRQPIFAVLLESQSGTSAVGDFSAFLKISGLNLVVLQSMKLLFLPVATRLYARGDHAGLDDLYWQTTIWIALMTFPVFVPCIAMADTMALVVNGREYVAASPVLVALAVGEYVNAAFGLNTLTLQVYARVNLILWTTLAATLTSVLLGLLWIPTHGPLGAACAYSAALVLQNLLHQYGLHRWTGVALPRRRYRWVYASLGAAVGLLFALDAVLHPSPWIEAGLVAAAALLLLRLHRETMDLSNVFPELQRLPWLNRLLGLR